MKIKSLFLLAVFLLFVKNTFAQNPTYTLKVDSMKLVSINAPNDAIEFGVYLTSVKPFASDIDQVKQRKDV